MHRGALQTLVHVCTLYSGHGANKFLRCLQRIPGLRPLLLLRDPLPLHVFVFDVSYTCPSALVFSTL